MGDFWLWAVAGGVHRRNAELAVRLAAALLRPVKMPAEVKSEGPMPGRFLTMWLLIGMVSLTRAGLSNRSHGP